MINYTLVGRCNVSVMVTKRIHNPVTGKYYELRQRSTVNGDAGQIKGLWSPKKKAWSQ